MKLYADKLLEAQEKLTAEEFALVTKVGVTVDELKPLMADSRTMEYLTATPATDPDFKGLPFGVDPSGDYSEGILLARGPAPIERVADLRYSALVGRWIWDVHFDARRWSSRYDGLLRGEPVSGNELHMSTELHQRYGKPSFDEFGHLVLRGILYPFFNAILSADQSYVLTQDSFREFVEPPSVKILGENDYLLTVVYRGQSRRYATVLTPSLFRASNDDLLRKSSTGVSLLRTYCRNAVREYLFNKLSTAPGFAEAEAFLHHFGLMRAASVVDVTRDVNVAKWFALSRFEQAEETPPFRQTYSVKQFADSPDDRDWSYVYKIVLCVPGQPKIWGVYDDLARLGGRPKHQAGLCLFDLLPRDLDPSGLVVSVSEHKYHPTYRPSGWDDIGGPTLEFATDDGQVACTFAELEEHQAKIGKFLFPEEEGDLCALMEHVFHKRRDHFCAEYEDVRDFVESGRL